MKSREEISILIEKLLSKEISPKERKELMELIATNKFVQEEFAIREKIDQAIRNKEIIELREQLRGLNKNVPEDYNLQEPTIQWYKMAAAIALLVGIGFLIALQLWTNKKNNSQSDYSNKLIHIDSAHNRYGLSGIGKKDSSIVGISKSTPPQKTHYPNEDKANLKEEIIAENFVESAYLESFITNYRSVDITIKRPQPDEILRHGSKIIFKWKGLQQDSLTLVVLNNQENVILRENVLEEFQMPVDLDDGLYYWKLETDTELIYIGKFFIK